MATMSKINDFLEQLCHAVHDLDGTHTLKVMLTNVAPVATNSVKLDLTEIAAGNGYTAGGTAIATVTLSRASGTTKITLTDVVFTATGGTMATFQYAVVYNDTPTTPADPLMCWYDYGSAIILLVGETFTVDFDATNGWSTFA